MVLLAFRQKYIGAGQKHENFFEKSKMDARFVEIWFL